jgi:hypothetical protein
MSGDPRRTLPLARPVKGQRSFTTLGPQRVYLDSASQFASPVLRRKVFGGNLASQD